MNNYIDILSCLNIEHRNYLSGPLVYGHIYLYFRKQLDQTQIRQLLYKQTGKTLIRQLSQELPDLGLLCLQRRLYEVKG